MSDLDATPMMVVTTLDVTHEVEGLLHTVPGQNQQPFRRGHAHWLVGSLRLGRTFLGLQDFLEPERK